MQSSMEYVLALKGGCQSRDPESERQLARWTRQGARVFWKEGAPCNLEARKAGALGNRKSGRLGLNSRS